MEFGFFNQIKSHLANLSDSVISTVSTVREDAEILIQASILSLNNKPSKPSPSVTCSERSMRPCFKSWTIDINIASNPVAEKPEKFHNDRRPRSHSTAERQSGQAHPNMERISVGHMGAAERSALVPV